MLKVKICGITNAEDAILCANAGADALGFIFADSPRRANREIAREIIRNLPPWIATVGVFVNESLSTIEKLRDRCSFTWIQLHGHEPPELAEYFSPYVIKTIFHPDDAAMDYPCGAHLLDKPKSEREDAAWDFNAVVGIRLNKPFILAGGLDPENIENILRICGSNLYGVDVTRGVEVHPGKKDPQKVLKFIERVKGYSK